MDGEVLRKPLVYAVPGMDQAAVHANLPYHTDADDALQMDVYLPPELPKGARRPGVLFIHGGPVPSDLPLRPKDWGVYRSYGQLMAASGLVGITFNHRYYGMDHLEQAARDIQTAIVYVRALADVLSLDADRLALWAFSGGGPFLSFALREQLPYVRCLVAYYALLALQPFQGRAAGAVTEAMLRAFSPAAYLEAATAPALPILIARAGQDQPTLNATIDAFVQGALAANLPIEVMNHPHGRHAFDILDADDRSREIIARTVAFVQAHLGSREEDQGPRAE
jgi:acetyl esterase/lipase